MTAGRCDAVVDPTGSSASRMWAPPSTAARLDTPGGHPSHAPGRDVPDEIYESPAAKSMNRAHGVDLGRHRHQQLEPPGGFLLTASEPASHGRWPSGMASRSLYHKRAILASNRPRSQTLSGR